MDTKILIMARTVVPAMDVSYSVWREIAAEKLEVGGESFSFLFDRRYSNRLNRMSRVFFEAYAKATLDVSAEEDRFPSLSEIESRMESGAIYAYKDRLMRSTGFFEEVKISGISYLIPKARRFVDETGTYTDLILDLEKGEVVLPRREKTSAIARSEGEEPEEEPTAEEELEGEAEDLTEAVFEPSSGAGAEKESPGKAELEQKHPEDKAEEARAEEAAVEAKAEEPLPEKEMNGIGAEERPPAEAVAEIPQAERALEAEAPKVEEPAERSPAEVLIEERAPAEVEIEDEAPIEDEPESPGEEILIETKEPEPKIETMETRAKAAEPERKPQAAKREAVPSKHHPPEKKPGKSFGAWGKDHKGPLLALTALVIMLAGFYIWSPSTPEQPATPAPPSDFVSYSAYLTNATGNTYLNLDVTNPKGLESKVELVMPPDVDKSISATGGIVTISYTNNTVIQLVSSNNASVTVALTDEYILVPVTFNLAIPEGYESSVLVYDKDYKVSRTNSTISLWCNCTDDHLDFDQIYNAKKVSGGPGPQERGPENATAGPSAGPSGPEAKDSL
jgi:hypothetical protein